MVFHFWCLLSFISLLLLFSFDYIDNSYGAFCKVVKYKDDGDNGYRIYIGTSTVGHR